MPTPLTPRSSSGAAPELMAAVEQVAREPDRLQAELQPIVDLRRGAVFGYELLARFPPPPAAAPDAWLRAAAAQGVSTLFEAQMVVRALALHAELPGDVVVAVNVSPHAVLADEVQQALCVHSALDGLALELTERVPVDDYAALRAGLAPLRERGALVAVDDAGSGYDSLRQILELRPELVKADRSLVAGVDHDARRAEVLQTLAAYTERVDAHLVAEGVERLEELDAVIGLGIGLAQGYLVGRPEAVAAPLAPGLAEHVRDQTAARGEAEGVGRLAEPVMTVPPDMAPEEVAVHARAVGLVMLVDEQGRPRGLLTAARAGRAEPVIAAVCVNRRTSVADAAQQAMARPPELRFEPLACCDEQGVLVGLVRIERLVEALAESG